MGNYASSVLITTDNKKISLGHVKSAPSVRVQGQCDGQDVNTCNYTQNDLENLYNETGSTTKKIKQVVAGKATLVYIYDQDNYTGNKYIVYPETNVIVPPCFTVKSVKQVVYKNPNDVKKLADSVDYVSLSIEGFRSVNNYDNFIVQRNTNNNYTMFVVIAIIILLYVYRKKIFTQNK